MKEINTDKPEGRQGKPVFLRSTGKQFCCNICFILKSCRITPTWYIYSKFTLPHARMIAESLICPKTEYTEVWVLLCLCKSIPFLCLITVNYSAFEPTLSILKTRSNYYVCLFSVLVTCLKSSLITIHSSLHSNLSSPLFVYTVEKPFPIWDQLFANLCFVHLRLMLGNSHFVSGFWIVLQSAQFLL